MRKLITSLLFFMTLPFCSYALDDGWDYELSFIGGYRNDRIETQINVYDPVDTFLFDDTIKKRNLSVFEVGLATKISMCDTWMIRGYVDYGWITNGKYRGLISYPEGDYSSTAGDVRGSHTKDFSIGLGYLFPLDCVLHLFCSKMITLNIGPVGGYSYHSQHLKMGTILDDGIINPVLDDLQYKMRWSSGWLGADALLKVFCLKLHAGYEFHWSHWHAKWLLEGPDVFGGSYSDKRKSYHSNANVAFVDLSYPLTPCWDFNIGFKYQHWTAGQGLELPLVGNFIDIGQSPTTVDTVPKAVWDSYELKAGFAWVF